MTRLANDSDSIRIQVIQMDAIPTLLKLLNHPKKKNRALKRAAAEGVRALMMGELRGKGMEKAGEARARALPSLHRELEITSLKAVKELLASIVEAFQ